MTVFQIQTDYVEIKLAINRSISNSYCIIFNITTIAIFTIVDITVI